jgi:DNA repair photolyase
VREVTITHLLEPSGSASARFYTCSPYVGCLIGCRFCYAQSRLAPLRAATGLPPAPWGSWVDVRVNAAEVLADELARLPARPIKFCPIVSDPYHAIEASRGVTRACLAAIAAAAAAPPVLLLTRAALVTRDVDLLAALPWAGVGVSLPTVDDDVRAHFEPRAASIPARLAALATLRAAGVRTIAVVQPMLPGPLDALADALAAHVASVSLDVLRGEEQAGLLFDDARFAVARTDDWQRARAAALAAALAARGVPVWAGELPPDLPRANAVP